MKTLLLTGATGFVGRHVLPFLIKNDFKVHAIFSKGLPLLEHANIHWHHINLHDTHTVNALLQKTTPSHLLHLAWYTKPGEYWTSLQNIDWLTSSIHMLNFFIKAGGKRAVMIGTCAEYDWQQAICRENVTPCLPQSLYGRAKFALYLLSESIAKQQNVELAWGRLFFLYGAYEFPQRLIASAIRSFLQKQSFDVINGHFTRDFMYIVDAAAALVALLDSNVTGPVNIASGQSVTIKDILSLVAKKMQAESFLHCLETTNISKDYKVIADVSRLQMEVNWRQQYSLDMGLDHTINWWNEQNG